MRIQASIEFLLIASAIAVLSLSAISLYGKQLFAQTRAFAEIANASQSGIYVGNYTQTSYASNTTLPPAYSASITQRNESLAYELVPVANVLNLTETSHCTYRGFFGYPLNIYGQCSTYDAWDYIGDSSRSYGASPYCPGTSTFCIFANDTGYSVSGIGASRGYIYSFSLTMQSSLGTMHASISSSASESPLLLGNKTAGYARVSGVFGSEPPPSRGILYNQSSYFLLNETAYGEYAQAKNAAYAVLSFYNSTSVDSSTQSSIQEAIYAMIKASGNLRGTWQTALPCRVVGLRYVCGAAYPFLYVIDVRITSGSGSANQTLYYLGSAIRVFS